MGLNANDIKGGNYTRQEAIPAGTYQARLAHIIDLGIHQDEFEGQLKPPRSKVRIDYELPAVFMKDEHGQSTGVPRLVSEEFALNSLRSELAKSTKRIKIFDPDNKHKGDLTQMLGAPCLLSISTKTSAKGTVYNKIENVSPPMAGMPCPALVTQPYFFDIDVPDMEIFDGLPQFIKDTIFASMGFDGTALAKNLGAAKPYEDLAEDDVPF